MKARDVKNLGRVVGKYDSLKDSRINVLFAIAMFCILVCYAFLVWKVNNDNNTPLVYNVQEAHENGIDIFIEEPEESWIALHDHHAAVGAQYNGVITNNTSYKFGNWILHISVPSEYIALDSSWNGNYLIGKECITVEPDKYINTIPVGEFKTFGFVMYADTKYSLEDISLKGYRVTNIYDYAIFWILSVLTVVWISSFIVFNYMNIRLYRIRRQNEIDEYIISQTMETFASFIDAKDTYTNGHSVRVSEYTKKLAQKMGMGKDEIKRLGYIALMHDCGKMGIPDKVLNKPEKLTSDEMMVIESHTVVGGRIMEKFSAIEGIRDGAMYHHERYDGNGYPVGLKGEEIPLYARIIGVADSFDAMNSDRCYRRHLSRAVILKELRDNAGTQFDPKIAEIMIKLIEDGDIQILD